MKLHQKPNTIETSGVLETKSFGAVMNPKAYAVLSTGIYTYKVRAIIRELSCNAVDAHVAAGNTGQPYEVTLPNKFNPTFVVRDYGTGLSHESVMNLYTIYFASDKTDSNELIGALGLGSKSPFAKTDSFTVESFFNGVHRTYTAFMNSERIPDIAFMHETPTEEPNGMRISFPVKEGDFHTFIVEAANVFSTFAVESRPKILGAQVNIPTFEYSVSGDGWGAYATNAVHHTSRSIAIMGNVAYPIEPDAMGLDLTGLNPETDRDEILRRTKVKLVLGNGQRPLHIRFPIGDLDFTASREQLQYDDATREALITRIAKIYDEMTSQFVRDLQAMDSEWDVRAFVSEFRAERTANMFHKSVMLPIDKALRSNALLADDFGATTLVVWRGREIGATHFSVSLDAAPRGTGMRVLTIKTNRWGRGGKLVMHAGYDQRSPLVKDAHFGLTVEPALVADVYVNDDGRRGLARIKHDYESKRWKNGGVSRGYGIVLTYEPALATLKAEREETDVDALNGVVEDFLKQTGFAKERMILASTVVMPKSIAEKFEREAKPRVRKPARRTSGLFTYNGLGSGYQKDAYWREVTDEARVEEILKNPATRFVYLDGFEPYMAATQDGRRIELTDGVSMDTLRALDQVSAGLRIKGQPAGEFGIIIVGVRRNFLKHLPKSVRSVKSYALDMLREFYAKAGPYMAVQNDINNRKPNADADMVTGMFKSPDFTATMKREGLMVGSISIANDAVRAVEEYVAMATKTIAKVTPGFKPMLASSFFERVGAIARTFNHVVEFAEYETEYRALLKSVADAADNLKKDYPMLLPMVAPTSNFQFVASAYAMSPRDFSRQLAMYINGANVARFARSFVTPRSRAA